MYKVIYQFLDLQDDNFHYKVGDTYPRSGKTASIKRVEELLGSDNKIGIPLIEKVETKKRTKRLIDEE